MTKEQLNEILRQHRLWLSSHGRDGTRANLREANLSGANLTEADLREADLTGAKSVMVFQAGKHTVYATSVGIQIGCEWHDIPTWIKKYKTIGKWARYTEAEIKRYGQFIKLVAKEFKNETKKKTKSKTRNRV